MLLSAKFSTSTYRCQLDRYPKLTGELYFNIRRALRANMRDSPNIEFQLS